MQSHIKLKSTPIREIIFGLSFQEEITSDLLEGFSNIQIVKDKFPTRNSVNSNIVVSHNQKSESKSNIIQYIFKSSSENKLLKIGKGSLTYHKLENYEHFENLADELKNIWQSLTEITGNLTVNNISVRYLNFIRKDAKEHTQDLVNLFVSHPFKEKVYNEYVQLTFPSEINSNVSVHIVSIRAQDKGQEGIILDIVLNRKLSAQTDVNSIFSSLHEMREIKNDIFFKSVTAKTVEKYSNG